ncbi:hypothetical protein EOA16_26760 [Mesorhizobium sp. M7A.F.Ca.US.008.03.1.1]|nr:hypothetical protein EOA16_26760 [Mesorhizobium sp. M7A.F.Ca.US.008.03.1.1]
MRGRRRSSSTASRNAYNFVIHGRSKERSDAAQTRGPMPRPLSAAAVRNSVPPHPLAWSRNGSYGLRNGASLLLRHRMTKPGAVPYLIGLHQGT